MRPAEETPWGGDYPAKGPRPVECRAGRWFRLTEGSAHDAMDGLYLWPACALLAWELLSRDLRGLTVCDAGCGLGLLGMVAADRGAAAVCLDADPWACERARLGAQTNGVGVAAVNSDFAGAKGPFGAVVASEVLYPGYKPEDLAAMVGARWTGAGPCLVVNSTDKAAGPWEQGLRDAGLSWERRVLSGVHPDGRPVAAHLWEVRRVG